MDNVIRFPKDNTNDKFIPVDASEVEEKMVQLKHYHISETIFNIVPILFSNLYAAGFEFDTDEETQDDNYIKDCAMLVEVIKSLLCKYHGIDHPLSEVADKIFTKNELEPGVLKIVDKLDISFKKSEKGSS